MRSAGARPWARKKLSSLGTEALAGPADLVRLDEAEDVGKPIGIGRNWVNNLRRGGAHGSHFLSFHSRNPAHLSKVTKVTKGWYVSIVGLQRGGQQRCKTLGHPFTRA